MPAHPPRSISFFILSSQRRRYEVCGLALLTLTLQLTLCQGVARGAPQLPPPPPSQSDELPPTEQLVWRPSFAITSLGYDTNVLNESEDPKRDFVATFGGKLRPIYQVGRVKLSGETGVQYNYFATLVDERGADVTLIGRADIKLGVVKPHVSYSYVNLKERFNAEVDTRARRSEVLPDAGVDFSVTDRMTLGVGVSQQTTEFNNGTPAGADLGRTLDRVQRVYTTSLRYGITPLTSLIASGDLGTHEFKTAPDRNGDRDGFQAGLEFSEDALITGHGTVGWRRVTLANPEIPDFSGFAGSINLSTHLGENRRLGVQAHRDVTFSYSEFRPYYVEHGLGASISQALGESVEVGAHVGRLWFDYVQPLTEPADQTYKERMDVVGGSIGYRLPSGYRISVNVESQRRRTNGDASRVYDNIRIFTAITPVLSF